MADWPKSNPLELSGFDTDIRPIDERRLLLSPNNKPFGL